MDLSSGPAVAHGSAVNAMPSKNPETDAAFDVASPVSQGIQRPIVSVATRGMFPWQTSGRSYRCTTKHTKSTKSKEKEAFEASFLSRPKVPMNLDRTPGHAIREIVGFFLRDLRDLRGSSNWFEPNRLVAN